MPPQSSTRRCAETGTAWSGTFDAAVDRGGLQGAYDVAWCLAATMVGEASVRLRHASTIPDIEQARYDARWVARFVSAYANADTPTGEALFGAAHGGRAAVRVSDDARRLHGGHPAAAGARRITQVLSVPSGTGVRMTDTMLEKVRKLLAKAEDPGCTPAEAAALNDKAAELIAKYGVDRALLAATTTGRRPGRRPGRVRSIAPYALDKAGLLGTVALRAALPQRPGQAVGRQRLRLRDAPVRLRLRPGADRAALHVAAGAGVLWPGGRAGAARRAGGRVPAVLAGRLHASGGHPAARSGEPSRGAADNGGGPSMALVLADRGGRVDRRVAEVYPRLGTAPPRRLAGGGRGHGYAAGQKADLGGARLGRATSGSLGSP